MTEDTTPAITADTPGVQGLGQAALFNDPRQLLDMNPASLRALAAEVAHEAGPVMAQIRRMIGLVCWAIRAQVPEGEYGKWVAGYSELVGVSARTLDRWRSDAMKASGIMNPYTSQRAKTAGQPPRLDTAGELIPAASTEAPAKKSEEAEPRPLSPPGEAPSDPSSESPTGSDAGGVEVHSRATTPPARLPSMRQVAAAWVADLHNTEEGFGAKWTPEEVAYVQTRLTAEMNSWRHVHGIVDSPKRSPAQSAAANALRRTTPVPLGGRKSSHDPTCSCFGCKPAKVAK